MKKTKRFLLILVLLIFPVSIAFADMSSGSYEIQADVFSVFGKESSSSNYTVNDSGGESGSGSTTGGSYGVLGGFWHMLVGEEENNAPTADANGPYSGTVGVPISFSSSGSDDPDGDSLEYDWDFGDGNSSSSEDPDHTYTAAGTYTVELTVTDEHGESDTDSTSVDVEAVVVVIPPECSLDADCDDGVFCNGAEACLSGTCVSGSDPCPAGVCDEIALVCTEEDEDDQGEDEGGGIPIEGEDEDDQGEDEDEPETIGEAVVEDIKDAAVAVGKAVTETTKAVKDFTEDNPEVVTTASTAVATVSLVPVVVQLTSLKDILALLASSIMSLFGLVKRKRKDWGIVYDIEDSSPISLAAINIYDEAGKKRDRRITDKFGSYIFLVPAGKYTLEIEKEGYELATKSEEFKANYSDNYIGGEIEITNPDLIDLNIPLQSKATEKVGGVEKVRSKRSFKGVISGFFYKIISISFYLGFAFSVFALVVSDNKLVNGAIVSAYVISAAMRNFALRDTKWGKVIGEEGAVAPFTTIQAFKKDTQEFVGRTISDERGRYVLILREGMYELKALGVKGSRWSEDIEVKKRSVIKKKIKLG